MNHNLIIIWYLVGLFVVFGHIWNLAWGDELSTMFVTFFVAIIYPIWIPFYLSIKVAQILGWFWRYF